MTEKTQLTLDGVAESHRLMCDGYGTIPADYMFVGISAGRLGALITKVPLTKDASGRIFQRILGVLGLSLSDEWSVKPILRNCYITNLVKGRVLTDEGLNRLPTTEEVEYWLPRLEEEVSWTRTRLIVALGEFVYNYLKPTWYGHLVIKVKHPRWYQAHGALSVDSIAFKKMVIDYRKALFGWEASD